MAMHHRSKSHGANGLITASSRRIILLYLGIRRRRRKRVKRHYRSVFIDKHDLSYMVYFYMKKVEGNSALQNLTLFSSQR